MLEKNCSSLQPPRETYIRLNEGCQNNSIDLNFHLQKSLEIFEKKSADKIWSNKDKGIKMSLPVPNRDK